MQSGTEAAKPPYRYSGTYHRYCGELEKVLGFAREVLTTTPARHS